MTDIISPSTFKQFIYNNNNGRCQLQITKSYYTNFVTSFTHIISGQNGTVRSTSEYLSELISVNYPADL